MASLSTNEERANAVRNGTERTTIYIGSRKSELAMIQTRHVKQLLENTHGDKYTIVIKTTSTLGDEVLDVPLSVIGNKNPGLFTKELEHGLIRGSYDLAVHSLKDMPTTLPETLSLTGILKREDPTDCLVLHKAYTKEQFVNNNDTTETQQQQILNKMPAGSIIGTSSLRRQAIIQKYYPHLIVKSIRGNLNTRLEKLDTSIVLKERSNNNNEKQTTNTNAIEKVHYDAIVLATSGIIRMGWQHRISQILAPSIFPYGVSQGSLGIESRTTDSFITSLIQPLICRDSSWRCLAERSFLRGMQGGCQVPLGVHSIIDKNDKDDETKLSLSGSVFNLTGTKYVIDSLEEIIHSNEDAVALGVKVSKLIIEKGGDELLKEFDVGGVPRAITYSKVAQ